MRRVKETIQKKFMLWLMVVVMLTGTVTTTYVETVQAETTVYVTRTGSKYHTHKCGNGTYYAATRSAALARGLTPCQKCYPYGDSSSSSSSSSSKNNTQKTVKAIKLNKSSLVMAKDQTTTLKVSNASGTVKWSSGDSSVVSVSSNGKLTAKSKGKATITVTYGSQTKQCKVTVEEPILNATELTMEWKGTKTLKLSGCKHSVKWSSSDSDTVKVKNGKLTAKDIGKATIKATVHGITYSCKVTVKKPVVTSIKLGDYDDWMLTDDSQEMEIGTKPSSAIDYYHASVTSSDTAIVTAEVIEDGDATYIKLVSGDVSGKATITVSIGGVTTSFTVEVIGDDSEMNEAEDDEIDDEIDDDVDDEIV